MNRIILLKWEVVIDLSIMRLEAAEYGSIDSRYIDCIDMTVQNLDAQPFDMLIQLYHPAGVSYVALHHVPAYGTLVVPGIAALQTAFSLLLVTNIQSYSHTAVTLYAKLNGVLVASYTQEDFIRLH